MNAKEAQTKVIELRRKGLWSKSSESLIEWKSH